MLFDAKFEDYAAFRQAVAGYQHLLDRRLARRLQATRGPDGRRWGGGRAEVTRSPR